MEDELGLVLTDAARVDSASRSAVFGLSGQSFARIPFSSARCVCSNSENLFDLWGIFYLNILIEFWIVRLESRSKAEVPLFTKHIQGAHDRFPDFFRMGAFIDSTHMKL